MEELLKEKTFFLDFHSLITVKASDLSAEMRSSLTDRFGIFLAEKGVPDERIDITVSRMDEETRTALDRHRSQHSQPFGIQRFNNETHVVFGYRGKADIAFTLSSPVKIFFTMRKGCAGKLFDCLMLCFHLALFRKKAVLFHGAVLSKQNTCVILTGPTGVGKTVLVLNMLREGWDYLSDDKCILHDRKVYLFTDRILLRDFHYEAFPWIQGADAGLVFRRFRKRLREFAIRNLPGYLYPRAENILDPFFLKSPADIFPACKILRIAEPDICILLQPGVEFAFAEAERTEALGRIGAVQWLDSPLLGKLCRTLYLYGYGNMPDIEYLAGQNLAESRLFEMTVPFDTEYAGLYEKVKQCLKRVL